MSRVKLMLDVIDDVCNVAESLQNLAASLKTLVQAIGLDEQPKLPEDRRSRQSPYRKRTLHRRKSHRLSQRFVPCLRKNPAVEKPPS